MTLYRVTALDCHYQPLEGFVGEVGSIDAAIVVRVPSDWDAAALAKTGDHMRLLFPARHIIVINDAVAFMRFEPMPEVAP